MSNSVEKIEDAALIRRADIGLLLEAEEAGPCISIYIDTLPEPDEKDKNRIRYKDRVKEAVEALESREMDKYVRSRLIDQLENIGQSEDFWLYQQYGLAVFLSPEHVVVRKLLGQPGNLAIVADSFHLRPALQITRNAMRHQILCVSTDQVELYEGDGHIISRIGLNPDVPKDMSQAIGVPARVHKVEAGDAGGEEDDQLRRYFRRVDEAVWKNHNSDANYPLLLTALSEHQGLFREVSSNPNLVDKGVERDPFHGLTRNELARLAWEQIKIALSASLDGLVERFQSESAHARGATSLKAIGAAAVIGQVETLLVEQDRRIAGEVDRSTGEVELKTMEDPHTNDVIDAITALTLRTDGDVWFLPGERMPDDTGAAAIFRFASG